MQVFLGGVYDCDSLIQGVISVMMVLLKVQTANDFDHLYPLIWIPIILDNGG